MKVARASGRRSLVRQARKPPAMERTTAALTVTNLGALSFLPSLPPIQHLARDIALDVRGAVCAARVVFHVLVCVHICQRPTASPSLTSQHRQALRASMSRALQQAETEAEGQARAQV